jgi:glycosyltransferase involved in cell wall biosynthesis
MASARDKNMHPVQRRPRLLIQQYLLPHYRVPLMREIALCNGFDVTIICSDRAREPGFDSGLPVGEAACGGTLRILRTPRQQVRLSREFSVSVQGGVIGRVWSRAFDAVVLEGSLSNLTGLCAAAVAKLRGVPVVWWTKGYFDRLGASKLRGALYRCVLRLPDAFIPYGAQTVKYLARQGVRESRIANARNTVEVERIHAQRDRLRAMGAKLMREAGIPEAAKVAVMVGRLVAEKRGGDFIAMMARLIAESPRFYGLVVGDGPERVFLRERASLLASNRIIFSGRVAEDIDNAFIAASDVAVFPGAAGLAINQAMALGCLVIMADQPGPDGEMIVHGVTGLRYPPGDAATLEGLVHRALSGEYDAAPINAAAQRYILTRHSLQQYALGFGHALSICQQNAKGSGRRGKHAGSAASLPAAATAARR